MKGNEFTDATLTSLNPASTLGEIHLGLNNGCRESIFRSVLNIIQTRFSEPTGKLIVHLFIASMRCSWWFVCWTAEQTTWLILWFGLNTIGNRTLSYFSNFNMWPIWTGLSLWILWVYSRTGRSHWDQTQGTYNKPWTQCQVHTFIYVSTYCSCFTRPSFS